MAILLQIIGYGWFLIGVLNLFMACDTMTELSQGGKFGEAVLGWLIISHMLLYWAPGLVVGGIGSMMARNKRKDVIVKDKTKTCPFCKESVLKEAIVCKHCGKDLPITKPKIKEKELPKKLADCPRCAEFRKQKILKCFVCGKDLTYDNSGLNKDNYDINGKYHLTKKEKERML